MVTLSNEDLDNLNARLSVPEPSKEKSLSGFGNNAWRSAKSLANSYYDALSNPVDTFEAVQGLASGYAQKAAASDLPVIGQDIKNPTFPNPQNVELADLVNADYANAYGDKEKILETLYNDPFRALSDASGVGTLGIGSAATALKGASTAAKAAKASKLSRALGKAGAVADKGTRAAAMLDPLTLGLQVARAPSLVGLSRDALYEHGLASSGAGLDSAQLQRATEAGMEGRIRLTKSKSTGLGSQADRLRDALREGTVFEKGDKKLGNIVSSWIDDQQRVLSGIDDIPIDEIYSEINRLLDLKSSTTGSVDPVGDTKRINKLVGRHRLATDLDNPSGTIPAPAVQKIKQTTGKAGEDAYSAKQFDPSLGLDEKTYAAIADGARNSLSKRSQVPGELDDINKVLRKNIDLQKVIDPAAMKDIRDSVGGVDLGARTMARSAGLSPGAAATTGLLASKLGKKTADIALALDYLVNPRQGALIGTKGSFGRSVTAEAGKLQEQTEQQRAVEEIYRTLYGDLQQ